MMMIKFGVCGHPIFPCPRVHCPEERWKAKEVENYQYTSVLMVEGKIESVFEQLFSVNQLRVSSEQLEPAIWRRQLRFLTDNPSQEDLLQKVPRTSGKALTTESGDQDSHWCRIFDHCWRRSVFHDNGHRRILAIYRTSGLSWVHFAKRWKNLNPKCWIQRNTKIWPVLEVTTSYFAR